MVKKIIAVTVGDPAGIGPEIIAKTFSDKKILSLCRPIIIGDINAVKRAGLDVKKFACIDTGGGALGSFKAVRVGAKLAMAGAAGALVTAPVSKQNWFEAGVKYTGHTDYFRQFSEDVLMMFVSGKLKCALVSEHVAIKNLAAAITEEKIISAGKLFKKSFARGARLALSALNPHGELGGEEKAVIAPAAKKLKMAGPLPIDSLWPKHINGLYDGILCMYHDQALLGLKLAAKEPVIHITYGLPFLRVSPTHGTAFDIAGKNKADPSGMKASVAYACKNCI